MRKNIGNMVIEITDDKLFKKYTRIKPLYKYQKIHQLIENDFFYLDQTDIFDFYKYDVRLRRNIMKYMVMFEEYLRALIGNQYLEKYIGPNNLERFIHKFGTTNKSNLKSLLNKVIKREKFNDKTPVSKLLESVTFNELLEIMKNLKLNEENLYYLPEYTSIRTLRKVKDLRNYVFHQRFLWECYQDSTPKLAKALMNFANCLPKEYKVNYINEINSSVKGLRVSSNFTIGLTHTRKNEQMPEYLYKYYSVDEHNFDAIDKEYLYLPKAKSFNDPNDSRISLSFNDSTSYLFDVFVDEYLKEMKKQNIPENFIESTKATMNDSSKRKEAIEMFKANENVNFKELLLSEAEKRQIEVDERINTVFANIGEAFDKTQLNLEKNKSDIKDKFNEVFDYLRDNEYYIGCLTHNPNSILMWTHYSNSHKGFQVKLRVNDEYLRYLYKVKYSYKKPLRGLKELQQSTSESVLKSFKEEFITKAKEWHYEDEYRLIINEIDNHKFYNVDIVEVTVGYNISSENKKRIAKLCKSKNIPLKQAVLRTQSYGVEYEQINIDDVLSGKQV